jgi:site-specific recombinase XerC
LLYGLPWPHAAAKTVRRHAYTALARCVQAAAGVDATGRVWHTRKGDTAYNAALIRAKIVDPEVNFHTLRHTFASHFVMKGGSLVKLQAILGHASVQTTQIYARLAPDYLVGATAILDDLGASISTQAQHKKPFRTPRRRSRR